jgi:hypothetical protein
MDDYYLNKYLWYLGILAVISFFIQSFFPMIMIVVPIVNDLIEQASWTLDASQKKRLQEKTTEKREREIEVKNELRRVEREVFLEKSMVPFIVEGEGIKVRLKNRDQEYEKWFFLDIRSIRNNNVIELPFEIRKTAGRVSYHEYYDYTKKAEIRAYIRVNMYITRKDGLYNPPEKIIFYRFPDSILKSWSPDGYGNGTTNLVVNCNDKRNRVEILGVID